MPDVVSKNKRSQMMANIRGADTKPELIVRRFLHRLGFRYRLHEKGLPGKPDLILRKHNAIVLVHGCYWHRHKGCKLAYSPKTRQDFWQQKFRRNVERDAEVKNALRASGWRVATIWECALRKNEVREEGLKYLAAWIESEQLTGEFPLAKDSD